MIKICRFFEKTPMFPMPIVTPRLLIRPPLLSDAAILNAAIHESFESLHQWMSWAKKPPTLKESEKYIQSCVKNWIKKKNREPYFPLLIFDKNTHEFLGAGGFHHYDIKRSTIETGYWIRTSQAGKGIMREAINAHTRYAFSVLKIKRITITCDPDNINSRKIPERLGYALESILLNHRRKPVTGALGNTLVYTRYDVDQLPELVVSWSGSDGSASASDRKL